MVKFSIYSHYPSTCPFSDLSYFSSLALKKKVGVFPGASVVKNPPANVGDTDMIPGLGRFPQAMGKLSLGTTTIEPVHCRARVPQEEKPLEQEDCAPQLESSPHLLQLEKAHAQQQQSVRGNKNLCMATVTVWPINK